MRLAVIERNTFKIGSAHHQAKLDEGDVIQARNDHRQLAAMLDENKHGMIAAIEQIKQEKQAEIEAVRAKHNARIAKEKQLAAKVRADLIDMYSAEALASKYGVHVQTMMRALRGETWSHLA